MVPVRYLFFIARPQGYKEYDLGRVARNVWSNEYRDYIITTYPRKKFTRSFISAAWTNTERVPRGSITAVDVRPP